MKKRATVSATDLRVRLGEMLRRLEGEDLVIEKGGIPVAVITRYQRGSGWPEYREGERMLDVRKEQAVNESDVVRKIADIRARYASGRAGADAGKGAADDTTWDDAMAAIREGWSIDGDKMIEDTYRWREEGSRLNRYYTLTEDGLITEVGDERGDERIEELSDRQRHLHRRDQPARFVADRGDTTYEA